MRPTFRRSPISLCLIAAGLTVVACSLCSSGCAGYQYGANTLYNRNIQTIYVPIARNDSVRHGLGVQLTEPLLRAIQQRTPYRIVNDPSADSVLTCVVTNEVKRVITETNTDEPRAVETQVNVLVTWVDRQNNLLMETRFVPPGELAFLFSQGIDFVPEAGQSITTAHLRAMEMLADSIVNEMEARW